MIVSLKNLDICNQLGEKYKPNVVNADQTKQIPSKFSTSDTFEVLTFVGNPFSNTLQKEKYISVIPIEPKHIGPNRSPLYLELHNNQYIVIDALGKAGSKKKRSRKKRSRKKRSKKKRSRKKRSRKTK